MATACGVGTWARHSGSGTAAWAHVAQHGGSISLAKTLHALEAENLPPAWECGWNHTTLRALITDRVAPGVVYTTFHHPDTQANVITTDYSDWATNCPEYKVTAVQITPSNGPSDWQEDYEAQATRSRRIEGTAMEPAE